MRADVQRLVGGVQKYRGESTADSARLQYYQAQVLPDAVRRAQQQNIALTDDPTVQQAAETLFPNLPPALARSRFAQDWPKYVNLSPDELAKIKEQAAQDAASGEETLTAGSRARAAAGQTQRDIAERYKDRPIAGNVLDLAANAPDMVVGSLLSMIPVAGVVIGPTFFASDYGMRAYSDARDAGMDDAHATGYGIVSALIAAGPQGRVASVLSKSPAANQALESLLSKIISRSAASTVAKAGNVTIEQSIAMALQNALQGAVDKGTVSPNMSFVDWLKRVGAGALQGAEFGAATGAAHVALHGPGDAAPQPATQAGAPPAAAESQPTQQQPATTKQPATTQQQPVAAAEQQPIAAAEQQPIAAAEQQQQPATEQPAADTAQPSPVEIYKDVKRADTIEQLNKSNDALNTVANQANPATRKVVEEPARDAVELAQQDAAKGAEEDGGDKLDQTKAAIMATAEVGAHFHAAEVQGNREAEARHRADIEEANRQQAAAQGALAAIREKNRADTPQAPTEPQGALTARRAAAAKAAEQPLPSLHEPMTPEQQAESDRLAELRKPAIPKTVKEKMQSLRDKESGRFADAEPEADRPAGESNWSVERYSQLPESRGGRIIATDIARKLDPRYVADPTAHADDTTEPARQVTDAAYHEAINDPDRPGRVLLTAGGTGSGKTTWLHHALEGEAHPPAVAVDSILSHYPSARAKIDAALDAGRNVQVHFADRNPEEAYRDGVLPRAMEIGRTVRVDAHAAAHAGSREVYKRLQNDFKGDPRVQFTASRGGEEIDPRSVSEAADTGILRARLKAALEAAHDRGQISDKIYEASREARPDDAARAPQEEPSDGAARGGGSSEGSGEADQGTPEGLLGRETLADRRARLAEPPTEREMLAARSLRADDVQHTVGSDGLTHTAESPNGKTVARALPEGGNWQLQSTETRPGARAQGEATARTERLASEANKAGVHLESGSRVSPAAQRVWSALKEKGWPVKTSPHDIDPSTGEAISRSELKGVHSITGPRDLSNLNGMALKRLAAQGDTAARDELARRDGESDEKPTLADRRKQAAEQREAAGSRPERTLADKRDDAARKREWENAPRQAPPLTKEAVQQHLSGLIAKMGDRLKVHSTLWDDDVPQSARDQAAAGHHDEVKGWWDPKDGSVHIVAGSRGHVVPNDSAKTAVHELVHNGLRNVLGPDYESVMQDVHDNLHSKPTDVRSPIPDVDRTTAKDWLSEYMAHHGYDDNARAQQQRAADEYIVHLAEHDLDDPRHENPGIMRRVYAAIRAGLRKLGIVHEYTDNDLRALIRRSWNDPVSVHARDAAERNGNALRFADSDNGSAERYAANDPRAQLHKMGRTLEEQLAHNPGYIRNPHDAIDAAREKFGNDIIAGLKADLERATGPAKERIQGLLTDLDDKYGRGWRAIALGAEQIESLPGWVAADTDVHAAAKEVIKTWRDRTQRQNSTLRADNELMTGWADLATADPKGHKNFMELLQRETIAQTNTSKPFERRYSKEALEARGVKNPEQHPDYVRGDKTRRAEHESLMKLRENLSPIEGNNAKWHALHDKVLAYLKQRDEDIFQALGKRGQETGASPEAQKNADTLIRERTKRLDPWIPLGRWGRHWGLALDADGNKISSVRSDSKAVINRWKDKIKPFDPTPRSGEDFQRDQPMKHIDPKFVTDVTAATEIITNAEEREALRDYIHQRQLESLPPSSIKKHGLHREGIPGYSGDVFRAVAEYLRQSGRTLAHLENNHKIEAAIDKVNDQVEEMQKRADGISDRADERVEPLPGEAPDESINPEERARRASVAKEQAAADAAAKGEERVAAERAQRKLASAKAVATEFNLRKDALLNPKPNAQWANAVKKVGYYRYIAFSPMTAAKIRMQNPWMAAQRLEAAHPGRGRAAMRQSSADWHGRPGGTEDVGTLSRAQKAINFSTAQWARAKGPLTDVLRGERRDAMEIAMDRGLMSSSLSHSVISEGSKGFDPEPGVFHKYIGSPTQKASQFLIGHAEAANRQITFDAAYRLGREDGMTHEQAIEHGLDIAMESHFDYSQEGKPRYLQSDLGGVIGQYKIFPLGATFRLIRDFRNSIDKDLTPQQRSYHGRVFYRTLAATAMYGGLFGVLPGQWLLNRLASGLMSWYGQAPSIDPKTGKPRVDPKTGKPLGRQGQHFWNAMAYPEINAKHRLWEWAANGPDQWLRDHFSAHWGNRVADSITDGPISGMTGISMSNAVGYSDLLSRPPNPALSGKEQLADSLLQYMGPGVSTLFDLYQMGSNLVDGQISRALDYPIHGVPAGVNRAIRESKEGVGGASSDKFPDLGSAPGQYGNTSGLKLVPAGGLNWGELALTAIGGTPESVQSKRERAQEIEEEAKNIEHNRTAAIDIRAQAEVRKRKDSILDHAAAATIVKDDQEIKAANAQVEEFNNRHPNYGISNDDIDRHIAAFYGKAKETQDGVTMPPRLRFDIDTHDGSHVGPPPQEPESTSNTEER
jgi:hypothetical protein